MVRCKFGIGTLSVLCYNLPVAVAFVPFALFEREIGSIPLSSMSDSNEKLLVSKVKYLGNNVDKEIRLVLASQSPRRREILDMMGLKGRYTVTPSPLDEQALQTTLRSKPITPTTYTRTLAVEKAKAVAFVMSQRPKGERNGIHGSLILGSDTIVDLEGQILEKPVSADDARNMLKQLSGKSHKVHTGVAIYHLGSGSEESVLLSSFVDTSLVSFASLSVEDIDAYVETGEPMDKAAGYGIQGVGGQLVKCIEGDFFTVMGLPMHKVSRELSLAISKVLNQ